MLCLSFYLKNSKVYITIIYLLSSYDDIFVYLFKDLRIIFLLKLQILLRLGKVLKVQQS